MVYDRARNVTVLFGGVECCTALTIYFNDTWEWDAASWVRAGVGGPPGREDHAMAYDSRRSITVVYGGHGDDGDQGDTWERFDRGIKPSSTTFGVTINEHAP